MTVTQHPQINTYSSSVNQIQTQGLYHHRLKLSSDALFSENYQRADEHTKEATKDLTKVAIEAWIDISRKTS